MPEKIIEEIKRRIKFHQKEVKKFEGLNSEEAKWHAGAIMAFSKSLIFFEEMGLSK
jgi:hypothetical protein